MLSQVGCRPKLPVEQGITMDNKEEFCKNGGMQLMYERLSAGTKETYESALKKWQQPQECCPKGPKCDTR